MDDIGTIYRASGNKIKVFNDFATAPRAINSHLVSFRKVFNCRMQYDILFYFLVFLLILHAEANPFLDTEKWNLIYLKSCNNKSSDPFKTLK